MKPAHEWSADVVTWLLGWLPDTAGRLVRSVHAGFWLGILSEERIDELNRRYHERTDAFRDEAHNRRGFYPLEQAFVARHLPGCESVLVGAVGGGRELLALRRAGFEAMGFDCASGLVERANALMVAEGLPADVTVAPPDRCPDRGRLFDAAIFGWNATMMVRHRRRRVRLLRDFRACLVPGAPLLLTFWVRSPRSIAARATAGLANALGRFTDASPAEVGDDLDPVFLHVFSEEEIRAELEAAGFEAVEVSTRGHGHAVGRAV